MAACLLRARLSPPSRDLTSQRAAILSLKRSVLVPTSLVERFCLQVGLSSKEAMIFRCSSSMQLCRLNIRTGGEMTRRPFQYSAGATGCWRQREWRLLGSFPHHLTRPTTGRRRHGVLQLIRRDSKGSLLSGPLPVRKRTVLDLKCKGPIRLVDRVSAKVGDHSLHHRFILLRGALQTVVRGEFGTVSTHDLQRITATAIEHEETLRPGTKVRHPVSVRAHGICRDNRPGSYKLLFSRLAERVARKRHQK